MRHKKKSLNLKRTLCIAVLCLCANGIARAQNLTGAINGVVKDPSGAVIPSATVIIASSDTGLKVRTVTTDKGGRYSVPSLLVGTYTVTAQAQGFNTTVVKGVALNIDQAIPIDFILRAGSVTTRVAVTAAKVTPDLEGAAASTLIPQKEVTELPLNQRNFLQFLSLQPGVNAGTGTISRGPVGITGGNNDVTFSVNGQAHGANGFFLDGADFLNHDEDTILGLYPSVDALQEVNLLRDNYGAQYGGNGAAIVNLVTKSGTTQFHGSAYLFFRNQLLNANGYFNNSAGLARIPFRYNDFGYTIGGPLYIPKLLESTKKNTFFFVSGEFLRSAQAATSSTSNVPTQAQRQGTFSTAVCIHYNAAGKCTATSTTVPQADISPAAQAFLKDVINKIPLPNNPNDPQGLLSSFNGVLNESQTLARVDHSFGEKLHIFARFLNDPYNEIAPEGIGGNTQSIPGLATTTAESGAQDTLVHMTIVPTPSWVIEGGISILRSYDNTQIVGLLSPENAPDFVAALTLPYPVLDGKIPTVNIDGFKLNSPGPLYRINPTRQAFLNVTHVMGRHNLLFGVNAEKMSSAYINYNDGNNGNFTFTAPSSAGNAQARYNQSFADFLIGYATSFSQQNTIVPEQYSSSLFEAYVQDNVRVTPRLVVNAGVRYSYWRQPTQTLLATTNFDPNTFNPANAPTIDNTGYICLTAPCKGGGTPNPTYDPLNGIIIPGVNSPYGRKVASQPTLNFAPRFGFAWDMFGNGKTALRGGYGIYYLWPGIWVNTPTGNPPAAVSASGTNVSFDNPSAIVSAQTAPPALGAIAVHSKTAYLQNFNLDMQQEFSGNILLDVAYSGNMGRHIDESIDINQPHPGAYVTAGIAPAGGITTSNTPELNRIRPYLGYANIATNMPIFTSKYNSLQTQIRKRFAGGSEIGASYTWSRALGIQGAQNIYDLAADYGPTSFQKNNIFAAQFVYELPFYRDQQGIRGHLLGGYELSGIVNLLSGGVSTANAGSEDPGGIGLLAGGSPGARPDQVADPNNGPKTIQEYFNTAAFAQVPTSEARPGNARPGSIYAPSTYLLTLSAMRNIRIGSRANLQLRAEAYNVLNHTNLNGPNTNLTSSSYGKISGNGDPRNMQLAAKFTF